MTPDELTLAYTDAAGCRHKLHIETADRSGRWVLERRHLDPESPGGWHHEGSEEIRDLSVEGQLDSGTNEDAFNVGP